MPLSPGPGLVLVCGGRSERPRSPGRQRSQGLVVVVCCGRTPLGRLGAVEGRSHRRYTVTPLHMLLGQNGFYRGQHRVAEGGNGSRLAILFCFFF